MRPIGSIVGKGNHSSDHVQRLKPRVEQVCRELGLQFATEQNEGRIYVDLSGGPAPTPPSHNPPHGGHAPGQQYQHGDHHHPGPHGTHHQQPNNHNAEIEAAVKAGTKILPKILRKLGCCTIM